MSTMTIHPPVHSHRYPERAVTETPASVRLRLVPVPAPVVSRAESPVRLTRRGRFVVLLVALVALLALGVAVGAGSVASQERGTPTPTRTVVVDSGETLWGIAGGLAQDGEVRAMIDTIKRLNALDTAMVRTGQRLRVPLTE